MNREKKYCLELDGYEYRIVVNALNDLRNSLIQRGRYTDAVDDLMIKIIDTKPKRNWFTKG